MTEWIKTNRHIKLAQQMKTLKAKLQGTWNYYGLIGNTRQMNIYYEATRRTLFKWLNRRSQRRSMTWDAFGRMLRRHHVLRPHIVEKQDRRMPCQKELSFCQRLINFLRPGATQKADARAS
jgi:hypothetical protein